MDISLPATEMAIHGTTLNAASANPGCGGMVEVCDTIKPDNTRTHPIHVLFLPNVSQPWEGCGFQALAPATRAYGIVNVVCLLH